jgi:hypothetical protein
VSVDNKSDECYKENAQYVDEFVKEYFKEDVELMDAIENSPSDLNLWCERTNGYCYVWWVLWVRVGW